MSTPVTSPQAHVPQAASMTDQWREFFAFLRRPTLPERASGVSSASLVGSMRLLALDFALMFVLLSALFTAIALGLEVPETALANIELTPAIIALVVLGAPLGEELVFRSWLSGRPGHVLAVLAIVAGALGVPFVAGLLGALGTGETSDYLVVGLGVASGLAFAIFALWYFRGRGAMRWFAAIFPLLYLLSAVAFALIHIFNFETEFSPILLLIVMPQLILGLVVAYARVQFGLWSAILIHALHNGTFIALVLAFPEIG